MGGRRALYILLTRGDNPIVDCECLLPNLVIFSSSFCSSFFQVWKRSGAWFYKSLPKYVHPTKEATWGPEAMPRSAQKGGLAATGTPGRACGWAHGKGQSHRVCALRQGQRNTWRLVQYATKTLLSEERT